MKSLKFLLSGRLLKNKGNRFSRPIINLSIAGVALGMVIILVAICITTGYKAEIRKKMVGMDAHIRISNYDMNYSFEPIPFERDQFFIPDLEKNSNIKALQYYATKVGVVKTENQVEGIVLKGIDTTFSWDNFENNIVEGHKIDVSNAETSKEIMISVSLSKKMKLNLGDKVRTYFIQDPPMQRSFTIAGIYETGMPEFDQKFAIVDLRHIQKLNNWDSTMVGGIEILINDFDMIDAMGAEINESIGYQLKAETIKQIYPAIFEWIDLFDMNVIVLMVITIFICMITMMSIFFIIMLEQTSTIGILKTLGMKTKEIVYTFLLMASNIILKGILWGNGIAFSLMFLQYHFHFIKLDPATYYISYIPLQFPVLLIVAVNLAVLLICLATLIIPAYLVSKKITPINAIRFD